MSPLAWNNEWNVGFDLIDRDHKVLVEQLNLMDEAVETGRDIILTESVLNVLSDYTSFHFEREQALMASSQYPGMASHIREHQALTRQVAEFQIGYRRGTVKGKEILNFLKIWLVQHIQKSDKAFGRHLHDVGPSGLSAPLKPKSAVYWDTLSVLVADGQPSFRTLMHDILTTFGVRRIATVANGLEAFDELAKESYSIVFADETMSPCGGLDLTRRIRQSQRAPNPRTIVILMSSGEVTHDRLRAATASGVHDLVIRPLQTNAVRTRLERLLTTPLQFRTEGNMLVPVRTTSANP